MKKSKSNNKSAKDKRPKQAKGFGTPTRGSNLVNNSKYKITPTGAEWLRTALDPFHDFNYAPAGYPDMDGSFTNVSVRTYKMTLTNATGQPKWDAHVMALPLCYTGTYVPHTPNITGGVLTQTNAYTQNLGPVTVLQAANAQQLFPNSAAWTAVGLATGFIDTQNDLGGGFSRVIAAGFEVICTTPEQYRGGSLTAYRMPSHATRDQQRVVDATGGNLVGGTCSTTRLRSLPATDTEASKLKYSVNWDASLGAYVPLVLSEQENPMRAPSHDQPEFWNSDNPDNSFALGQKLVGGAVAQPPECAPQQTIPFCPAGVFLTGLDDKASFTVIVKYYVERTPTLSNQDLLAAATPSAEYDPAALVLYDEVVRHLPVATQSANNSSGDWFRSVLSVINKVISPVTDAFGFKTLRQDIYRTSDNVIKTIGGVIPLIP